MERKIPWVLGNTASICKPKRHQYKYSKREREKHVTQRVESRGNGKPDLHLGYAFQASSCMTRACAGASFESQAGALLQKYFKIKRS